MFRARKSARPRQAFAFGRPAAAARRRCRSDALCAWVLLTLADETARTRLVRTLLDAAYRWGWLGGVQSMPDLGELQSDLDEPGEQAD